MLLKIDMFLLTSLERFTHKFQRLTGKTNFWLASQMVVIRIMVYIVWILETFEVFAYIPVWLAAPSVAMSTLLLWLVGVRPNYRLAKGFEIKEKDAYLRVAKGLANPKKIAHGFGVFRIVTLISAPSLFLLLSTLSTATSTKLGGTILGITIPVQFYLEACDPLPPCSSKIMDWFRSFRKKPVPAESQI
jgi:hypothetical protein